MAIASIAFEVAAKMIPNPLGQVGCDRAFTHGFLLLIGSTDHRSMPIGDHEPKVQNEKPCARTPVLFARLATWNQADPANSCRGSED